MANDLENAHQPRPPILLLAFLLLLGTLFAWWGTRDYRRMFGESLREPVAAADMVLPQLTQEDSALLDRGSRISQRQCAGCHERAARSSAPSYREIATFYRQRFPASLGNPDLRARLASAITHPRPGWGNFAPGPSESALSLDDRFALASWILSSFDRDKDTGEGSGQ